MAVFHQGQDHEFELHGNHMVGLARPGRGAQHVEVWRGKMDPGAATPPHSHEHEEVVFMLSGRGRATVGDQEVRYEPGDTVILPANTVHQIFAESVTEFVAAMPLGTPIRLPDGELLDLPWRK